MSDSPEHLQQIFHNMDNATLLWEQERIREELLRLHQRASMIAYALFKKVEVTHD